MKKNSFLELICSLIVIVLVLIGFKTYDEYIEANNNTLTYPLLTYNTEVSNFSYINQVISQNKVYLLYNSEDYYLLKEIDITTNKENVYSAIINSTCKLQNENSYPYIYCSDNSTVEIYDITFNKLITQDISSNYNYSINTNNANMSFSIIDNDIAYKYIDGYYQNSSNAFVSLDTPYIKDAYCTDNCLLIRYNDLTEMLSLYRENELLETNIAAYQLYSNGVFTYNNSKIKIYDENTDEYKEFNSPIVDLINTTFTLGANDYYLYVLNDNVINVYNLYDSANFTNIDISKVKYDVNNLTVNNNYLYLFTDNILYVYDIREIEFDNSASSYEDELINSKIAYYNDIYNVNINITSDPSNLSSNYNITPTTNYNDIIDALEDLERYFLVFNADFFQRFTGYGMDGLEIYLVDDITSTTKSEFGNADVVGLFVRKNNKYNIILKVNSEENINTIAFHETFHAIEDYLASFNITFANWDNLNPDNFTYSNIYYTNQIFTDTLNNNKYNNGIYFIDNYARSNALEDRARTFEYICQGEDFSEYPHLQAKAKYIKQIVLANFPELYNSSYFI